MKRNNLSSLQQFSEFQREVPLAGQLPYWDFLEDSAVLSDGTMVKGFKLKGLSLETWDTETINQFTSSVRSVLNAIPDSYEISLVNFQNSDFGELLNAHEALKGSNSDLSVVSEERLSALRHDVANEDLLKPNLHLMVYGRYQSTSANSKSFLSSFFSKPSAFQQVRREEHEKAEQELRQVSITLCSRLDAIGVRTVPLSRDEMLALAYEFLNPKRSKTIPAPKINSSFRNQEFLPGEIEKVPELSVASPREQLVFSDLIHGYETIFYDGFYHRIITLKTLPEFTYSAFISRLMGLPFPHVLNVHIKVPEQSKELSALQAKRRVAHSMSVSQGGRATDLESEAKLNSTEELLRELINTGQKIFYFQVALMVRESSLDLLEQKTRTVLSLFRELNGAEGLSETLASVKVWKTMLPFGTVSMVRGKRVKTDNLADFLPLYEPYQGAEPSVTPPICLFKNRYQGLVSYNPFDPSLPNYNTLVTGSSGAGKSFLNNLVLLQYATQNPMIYVIDIGGSYKKLCEFLGGQYIEIQPPQSSDPGGSVNPFDLPADSTEPSPQKIKFLLALLENIFSDSEQERLKKLDKSLLEESILKLYGSKKGDFPRFSDLAALLAASNDENLKNFSRMLYPWTGTRPYGRLLDAPSTLDLASPFVVFDLKGLSSYPDLQSVMILIITDFILGKIESKDPAQQGRKKRILMDECWELLKSEASSHFMEYCVRTLRKTGSGITFITQGLEEIVASSIGSAILSNTATKFILLQRGDLEPIRKLLKLNDQEMGLISSLRQKKGEYSEAFLMANEARTVIRACPTPIEYWLATSDAADNSLLGERRSQTSSKPLFQHLLELAKEYPFGAAGGRNEKI